MDVREVWGVGGKMMNLMRVHLKMRDRTRQDKDNMDEREGREGVRCIDVLKLRFSDCE